jgi:putative peptide maturation dehydrogenase
MARFRRTKYLFVHWEDREFVDIARLLRGEAAVAPLRRILAISTLTAKEHVLVRSELDLLLSVPSDAWVNRDGSDAEALRALALRGLLLSDEPDDRLRELVRRDQALSSSQWNIYAALYHFLTKWRDVDTDLEPLDEEDDLGELEAEGIAAFVEAYGPAPPHFHSVADPLEVKALPVVEPEHGVWSTLARRRTTREFTPEPLAAEELSLILRHTFGCWGYSAVADGVVILRKTSPSGGALHPTEVYPLIRNVEGIAPGLYHYGVERHELALLEPLSAEDGAVIAAEFASGQPFVRDAPALFLLTTRFYRSFWKYRRHRRAYAVLLMDAAHLTQTFYLVCAELGLGAFVTAAVNGANMEERLGLDPFAEGALAMCGCGRPAVESAADWEFDPYVPGATTVARPGRPS